MKKVKTLTIILIIILLTTIAVLGIYIPKQNKMENIVKDYTYGMDLKGARVITLKADTSNKTIIKDKEGKEVSDANSLSEEELKQKEYVKEEIPYNHSEVLNQNNYKKSKEIIEKRLQNLGLQNYEIRLNEQNGDIIVKVPEDSTTDNIISNLGTAGKFEIVDSQTNEVLMDNGDIEKANVMYGSNPDSAGTMVYLNIEFDKEGTKKLEEISGKYKNEESTSNTTNEEKTTNDTNTENNTEKTKKEITMKIDDETIMTTDFEEPLKTGKLQLSVGNNATDEKTLNGYIGQASSMATVLDAGNMPIKYTIDENKYILSDITKNNINTAFYVIAGIVAISLIVLIVRYKTQGLLGAISYIGLASLLSIILRYTNVVISIEGIIGIILVLILNYIFVNKLLAKLNKKQLDNEMINQNLKETYKEFFMQIIPICIATITFCFINYEPISSFGMVMFWGIVLIAIYNIVITNLLMKCKTKETNSKN